MTIADWKDCPEITDPDVLRQALQDLRDQNRRQVDFMASLAHEVRTPLQAILYAAEVTNDYESSVIIKRQAGIIKRIVDDVMDHSRIQTGKIQLRVERIKVHDLIRQAVESANPLIQDREHALEINEPSGAFWFDGDSGRLQQSLVNLLTNAAKYTEPGGRIELSCEVNDVEVSFVVRDNGVGIKPENILKIFDMWSQESRSLSKQQGGLGIGLSLVKQIAELHRGEVSVESPGEGKGSTFTIVIPRCQKSAPQEVLDDHPVRVLLVDDNKDAATSLSHLLRFYGHQVEVAFTGTSGIAMAMCSEFDLIVLDINLPDMNGVEVCQELRSRGNRAKIVALSGDPPLKSEGNFDHCFVKPMSIDSLRGYIQKQVAPAVV